MPSLAPPARPLSSTLSRRRMIEYDLSSWARAPLSGWAQEAPLSGQEPDRIAAATDAAQRLTVEVHIDGRGPYRFVVDTGADRSVIADDVAASLGLLHGDEVMLKGIVRTLITQTVAVRELALGSVRRKHLQMPVLPRAMLAADGYLGLDTIDGARVTFDFKNRALEIGEPHSRLASFLLRPSETRVHTYGSAGHLRALDCSVGGVPASAFIDSGAEVAVGNIPLLDALLERRATQVEVGTLPFGGVTGGEVAGRVTRIDRIRLQELEFTDCTLVIADLQVFDLWELRHRPAVLIGMKYLRQFSRVAIDYGLKEIRFDLASLASAQPA